MGMDSTQSIVGEMDKDKEKTQTHAALQGVADDRKDKIDELKEKKPFR